MRRLKRAAAAVIAVALTTPALAHVSLTVKEARAGSTYRATLVVGHGCEGAATIRMSVRLPEGFYDAKPMPKAGWTVETSTGDYATPFDNHGTIMTSGVREISWSGGNLPDSHFDEFVFRGTIAPDAREGARLYFPVIQSCGDKENAWTDGSGNDGVRYPAPFLKVTPAEAGHGH